MQNNKIYKLLTAGFSHNEKQSCSKSQSATEHHAIM